MFLCNSHELHLYLCFILVVFYIVFFILCLCIIVTNLALWLQDLNKLTYLLMDSYILAPWTTPAVVLIAHRPDE